MPHPSLRPLIHQTLHIPPLAPLFAHWPLPVPSPHRPLLARTVSSTLARVSVSRPLLARRRRSDDIALLASLWFPRAATAPDRARGLARFAVWLVCWDDGIDQASGGDAAVDLAAADAWRGRTLDAAAGASVGPGGVRAEDDLNDLLVSFTHDLASAGAAGDFMRELRRYVSSCGDEQRWRLGGNVPDFETYMSFRTGTVGGGLLCSLAEYALGMTSTLSPSSPGSAQSSISSLSPSPPATTPKHVLSLRHQVNVLLSLTNDLLSLKKEMRADCAVNAVVSLLQDPRGAATLGSVVDEVLRRCERAVGEFDDEARRWVAAEEGGGRERAETVADAYRAIVTGTLRFTYVSQSFRADA